MRRETEKIGGIVRLNTPELLIPEVNHELKQCPGGSVAVIVWGPNKKQILLMQRANDPTGVWSLPTGHVENGKEILQTAQTEVEEETKLLLSLSDLRSIGVFCLDYPCRRPGGNLHTMTLLQTAVEAINSLPDKTEEAQALVWIDREWLAYLAKQTALLRQGELSEAEWRANPGLLPATIFGLQHVGLLSGKDC